MATFRRSIKIDTSIRNSQKDKIAFDALLSILEYLTSLNIQIEVGDFIDELIKKFIALREQSIIELARINRLRLEQYKDVLQNLLSLQSGGLLPVLITLALLNTINKCFSLGWNIECQGINESDSASGAGGDITIKKNNEVLCVLEVTERPIDSTRVISTFNSKIVRKGISDYLFVYKQNPPTEETIETATRYFGQGHEINFIQINDWVWNNLATMGPNCRTTFLEELIVLLDKKEIPSSIKVKWNEIIRDI